MKILHTSDWHIGRSLYGQSRYHEFEAFFCWINDIIAIEEVDAVLVSGDIFDNTTPSNRSQELYYRFLCDVARSSCRHVVITSGNHDSPSFLNAPKELLRSLDVHVVGAVPDNFEDEVLVLKDKSGNPELIVCAVPYLRDRDLRLMKEGESLVEKDQKLVDGLRQHYNVISQKAKSIQEQLDKSIPIVAMGHLFVAGGKTAEGDGVRELYVGSIANIGSDIFDDCIDYLALGHLHVPQVINKKNNMRYSGSPIPMGFGEAQQQKSVCLVDFSKPPAQVRILPVPVFQCLARLQGDWNKISNGILEFIDSQKEVWVEIVYKGEEIKGSLVEDVEKLIEGSEVKVLRIKNTRVIERVLHSGEIKETLDDLDVYDVFERCLDAHEIYEDQRSILQKAYHEVFTSVLEDDTRKE